jgi:hypothetical protein
MGIAESFQAQPSSHQIRLPQDSEYNENKVLCLFDVFCSLQVALRLGQNRREHS